MTWSQVAGGVSRTPPSSPGKIPALLNSTCSPPQLLVAAATTSATWDSSETSAATATARPPAPTICSTVSRAAWATTSATTTAAPSEANSVAATRPIPLPAPVITATLPASRAVTARPYPARPRGLCPGIGSVRPTDGPEDRRRRCDTGRMATRATPIVGVTTYHQQASWGPWDRVASVLACLVRRHRGRSGERCPVLLSPWDGGISIGRRRLQRRRGHRRARPRGRWGRRPRPVRTVAGPRHVGSRSRARRQRAGVAPCRSGGRPSGAGRLPGHAAPRRRARGQPRSSTCPMSWVTTATSRPEVASPRSTSPPRRVARWRRSLGEKTTVACSHHQAIDGWVTGWWSRPGVG